MARNYPTVRRNSPSAKDYQQRMAPPRPANDNYRGAPRSIVPPKAANDNTPSPVAPLSPFVPPDVRRMVRRWYWERVWNTAYSVGHMLMAGPRTYHDNGWNRLYGPCPIPPEYAAGEGYYFMIGPGCVGMTVAGDRSDWKAGIDPSWATAGHWVAGEVWGPGAGIRHYTDIGWERTPTTPVDAVPEMERGTVILPGSQPMIAPLPGWRNVPIPDVERRLDPDLVPVGQPQPNWPLPWRVLPLRPNTPNRDAGNRPPGDAQGRLGGERWRAPVGFRSVPGVPGVRPFAPAEWPAPPVARQREGKLNSNTGRIMQVINALTEVGDLIDSLWRSLPRSAQTRVKGQLTGRAQKAADVYRNFGQIDPYKAISNIIEDEAKDRFFGAIGKMNARLARRLRPHGNLPIGFQTGGWDSPPRIYGE